MAWAIAWRTRTSLVGPVSAFSISIAARSTGENSTFTWASPFRLSAVSVRRHAHDVGACRAHVGDAGFLVRHRAHLDAREGRRATPVGGVGDEFHLHAAGEIGQAVRATADRMLVEPVIAELLDDGTRHDRQFDELGEQHGIGALGRQTHLVGADRLGVGDGIELAELRALERRIGDALDGEDHVVGGEEAAVLEADVVTQGEDNLRVGLVGPGGGDLRNDLAGGVAGDEVVEHVAIDEVAVRVPLHLRVERSGVVHEIHHEQVAIGAGWRQPRLRAGAPPRARDGKSSDPPLC